MWPAADTICPPTGLVQEVELKLNLGISSVFGLSSFLAGMDARQEQNLLFLADEKTPTSPDYEE
jgi:hypothetical protein